VRKRGALVPLLLVLLLFWLVGYPLLLTLLEALAAPHWTLAHFADFARRPAEWAALWASLWVSLATVALAAMVGVPLAFVFERREFPGRRLLGSLVALPVALPPLIGVIAFLFLYGESGFASRGIQAALRLSAPPWRLSGPAAILLVHAYSMYVYFYTFTRAGLARLDGSLLEAAQSLGAGRGRVLRAVTLPLLVPALSGAALLTFMTSLASFSAPYVFGGSFRVMTTQIVASKLNGDDALAMVETVTLAAVGVLGLWLLRRIEGTRLAAGGVRGIAPRRREIGTGRWAATAAGWGLALFLLAPHATLLLVSFVPRDTWTTEALPPVLSTGNYRALFEDPVRLTPIVNSLWMATAATALAIVLGLAAAIVAARRRGAWGGAIEGLVAAPWALPGTVFAVALAAAFSVHAPWAGRFVLVGTAAILPLGYLVRSLPLTGRAAFAGLRQMDPALEEAAASLGASRALRLRRIVLPHVRPALAAGASLAFLAAVGDFVVSIVLYTYDTRPISIEILSSLRIQEIGVAAAYGVLLTALSAAAFLVWGRRES
jgi:iron(III) transport system permease protein